MFDRLDSAQRRLVAAACLAMLAFLRGPVAAAQGQPQTPLPAVRGQGDSPAPPVTELVARALANAPSLAARRERLAAVQATLPTTDVAPDPMIEFEWRNGGFPRWTLGSDQMTMVGATYRQPLLSKGRKTTRRAAAAAEVDVRHAEIDQTACDLTMAVRTEYSRLYAIDQELAILHDSEVMARLLTDTATARYAAGGSDQASVLRAQLERTRLAERAADLAADRTMSVATLNRLLNEPPATPVGEVRSLPEPPALAGPLASLPAVAANVAPEVAVRKAEVAAAAKRVEAARADVKPTWTLGGSFFWQGNTERVVSLMAGVEWPLRKNRRQLPMIAASERELAAARFELEDTASGMRAEAARRSFANRMAVCACGERSGSTR